MTTHPFSTPRPTRGGIALALVAALHLALLYGWSPRRRPPPPAAAHQTGGAITWLRFPAGPARPAAPPARAAPQARQSGPAAPALPVSMAPVRAAPTTAAAAAVAASPPSAAVPQQAAEAPAPRSADDILQQARRDIGTIDRDLRRQYHEPLAVAPADTPQKRMERGFAEAAAAVPNRWYESAKITEMTDQGGRRIYKVVGAGGTYCVYADPNRAPDGAGGAQGPEVRTATCPRDG